MKKLIGRVVSTKMTKTAVVAVNRMRQHPIYKKRLKRTKKYPSHDEIGVKKGDKVIIQECRPISKSKRWKVVEVIKPKIKNQK